jgi:hypothetical protein
LLPAFFHGSVRHDGVAENQNRKSKSQWTSTAACWTPRAPATLAEALSNPKTLALARPLVAPLPLLDVTSGYWLRVAETRAKLIGKKLKARLADALIAQSCMDADVPLITRDRDFRHFATHCGLNLA